MSNIPTVMRLPNHVFAHDSPRSLDRYADSPPQLGAGLMGTLAWSGWAEMLVVPPILAGQLVVSRLS